MTRDLRGAAGAAAYKLLTNLVVPRPIAWVSSRDTQGGINLAPFSFFNLIGSDPPLVVLGIGNGPDGRPKHTGQNIAATGEFVVNLVTEDLAHAMNLTSADFPEGHSELEAAGLHPAPGQFVAVPRVAEAKAALECTLHSIQQIGSNNIIMGIVVGLYTAEGLVDERSHVHNFHTIARMGGPASYARTLDQFELPRVKYADWTPQETKVDD